MKVKYRLRTKKQIKVPLTRQLQLAVIKDVEIHPLPVARGIDPRIRGR